MDIELRPMNLLEIQNYLTNSIKEYAQAMLDLGEYPNFATAHRASETEVMGYYYRIAPKDTHFFYHVIEKSSHAVAGTLAFSFLWLRDHQIAFVDYIEINHDFRRKGYAKQAMMWMETFVRKHKINIIDLNVMMNKTGARKLYESLGYKITQGRKFGQMSVISRYDMRKTLS